MNSSQQGLDGPQRLPGTPAEGWPCTGGCVRRSLSTREGAGYRCWSCRHNDGRVQG